MCYNSFHHCVIITPFSSSSWHQQAGHVCWWDQAYGTSSSESNLMLRVGVSKKEWEKTVSFRRLGKMVFWSQDDRVHKGWVVRSSVIETPAIAIAISGVWPDALCSMRFALPMYEEYTRAWRTTQSVDYFLIRLGLLAHNTDPQWPFSNSPERPRKTGLLRVTRRRLYADCQFALVSLLLASLR